MVKDVNWFSDCFLVWRYFVVFDLNVCKDILDFLVSKIVDILLLVVNLLIFGCKGIIILIWEKFAKKVVFLKYFDISRFDMIDDVM